MTSAAQPSAAERVVLGIDDRPDDDASLRWACTEAAGRGLPLHIVHAYSWPPMIFMTTHIPTMSPDAWQLERESAQSLVTTAVERAAQLYPELPVTGEAVAGRPGPVLIDHAATAAVLVIGSRHPGRHTAHLLGSVGHFLTAYSPCPVIVVRPGSVTGSSSGRVVLAVNLAEPAPQALDLAFAEARQRGRELFVLGYWRPVRRVVVDPNSALLLEPGNLEDQLQQVLAACRRRFPDVRLDSVVCRDDLVPTLVDETSRDLLLVLNNSQDGALSRFILHAVSNAVLSRAHCSVAVAPGTPHAEEQPAKIELLAPVTEARADSAVVVGIGGSDYVDDIALNWAAEEAQRRNCTLRLVAACNWVGTFGRADVYVTDPDLGLADVRRAARLSLARAERAVRRWHPAVAISTAIIEATAAEALVVESATARLIVVGSRQLKAVGSFMLGSVSAELACRSQCPVVVVRGPAAAAGEPSRIIAGIDGSPDSEPVLRFAFEEASLTGQPLHVSLVWSLGLHRITPWRRSAADSLATAAKLTLAEALAGWQENYPDVVLTSAVECGNPADVLVAESHAQWLLVVGSRAHSATAGTMLGSVSQDVLHHATCPVAVVHARQAQ